MKSSVTIFESIAYKDTTLVANLSYDGLNLALVLFNGRPNQQFMYFAPQDPIVTSL